MATVLAAVMIVALLCVAVLITTLGSAVAARHRAQTAADLGALAGAEALPAGPVIACQRAVAAVAANGASVTDCRVENLDVVLGVQTPVGLAVGNLTTARASARAGPPRRTGSRHAG
ncbi:hypothetical protein MINS_01740 [Mycolicibacterium insubricum]|uniref:Putative Flp pilus-assembly TadG-like N-terminal domain-containing protein n=1 Tax=Mycolicibacterium insubricum TaxID=444597 RepID=A0A1X0DNB8_9MYCO|nr:Rv3654c family TadE-like protein [Mycolicibacterium insubricum]MCB9439083.1 flp pilus-assembly TadE/G-like family protein [Mycolicibacterium sp.]ORA73350.1 hypothetical protein BST26_02820 [Mycolicibacterium insubricum]BBZ64745.1 hypothetical protein MINS_01740 [Mycolicibacterium insubricum]